MISNCFYQKMASRIQRRLTAFICISCYGLFSAVLVSGQDIQKNELLISIELNSQPLSVVINEISKQTGWLVRVDEKLTNFPVSGKFEAVSVDFFFQRALRGQNVSVLYDNKKKYISVRSFGQKVSETTYVVSKGLGIPYFSNDQEEIRRLHAMQEGQLQEYENNPDSVEPLTGIKLSDINLIQKEQEGQLQEYENNPDSVEPLTGMKLSDIKLIQERQEVQLQEYEDSPESVEPLTRLKLSDIKSLHAKQERQLQEYENSPEAVEPFTGIRLSEIRALHARQQKILDGSFR